MIRELIRDHADHVIVRHVKEFSIPRLARNMADHGGRSGRLAVVATVAGLRATGIQASGLVREADFGHVARAILDAANEFDARVIVLGARRHTGSPRLPPGGMASHMLHLATRPVLTVPHVDGSRYQADARLAARN
jgi:nucleotide-binding universal stress UspA family protein